MLFSATAFSSMVQPDEQLRLDKDVKNKNYYVVTAEMWHFRHHQ